MDDQGAAPAAVAVTATVVAVIATLAVPHWLSAQGPRGPSEPDPSSRIAPVSVETRAWHETPASIDPVGQVLENVGGRRLLWRDTAGAATLRWDVAPSGSERWVLAGSSSAGGSSRVAVVVGDSPPVVVPSDQLSLFAVPGHARTRVTVTDVGTPLRGEVLRIVEYAER